MRQAGTGIGVSVLIMQHPRSMHGAFVTILARASVSGFARLCGRIIRLSHTLTLIHARLDDGRKERIYVEHLARRRQVCSVTTRSVQSA